MNAYRTYPVLPTTHPSTRQALLVDEIDTEKVQNQAPEDIIRKRPIQPT